MDLEQQYIDVVDLNESVQIDIAERQLSFVYTGGNASIFHKYLGGAVDSILRMNILIYLNSKELCILSKCCHHMNRISSSPYLWTFLYYRDFIHDGTQTNDSTEDFSIWNNSSSSSRNDGTTANCS